MGYKEKAQIIFSANDKEYRRTLGRMRRDTARDAESMRRSFLGIFAIGAGAAGAGKIYADFEEGLAKVRKTSGLAGKDLDNFGKSVRNLSKESIFSTTELLNVASAAAQIGVTGADNIRTFTEVIAKMETATDLAGEEAARTLAAISNLTNTPYADVERLGSAIVGLGNKFATTEAQIADNATEIAAGVAGYNVTADKVLALAATTSALKQQGAKSATAIAKALGTMGKAVREGGEELNTFAELAGMSTAEFSELFERDAVAAFDAFITGLKKSGGQMDVFLEKIGMTDIRTNRVFKALAQAQGGVNGLSRALAVSAEEFEKNTALQAEYAIFAETLNSQWAMLKNRVVDLALEVGQQLLPTIQSLTASLKSLTDTDTSNIAKWIIRAGKLTLAILALNAAYRLVNIGINSVLFSMRMGGMVMKTYGFAVNTLIPALKTLGTAAGIARLKFALMWGAATFGVATFLAYLPEIVEWFSKVLPPVIDTVGRYLSNQWKYIQSHVKNLVGWLYEVRAGIEGIFRNTDHLREKAAALRAEADELHAEAKANESAGMDETPADTITREGEEVNEAKAAVAEQGDEQEKERQTAIEARIAAKKEADAKAEAKAAAKATKKRRTEQSAVVDDTLNNLKMLLSHNQKARTAVAAIEKASALKSLAINTPKDARGAYGQAVKTFPPPFGQILGAVNAGLVIAGAAAATAQITAAKQGALVPDTGIPGDIHPYLLERGEVVTPAKDFDTIRSGILAEAGIGQGDYDPDNAPVARIEFVDNAGSALRQETDQSDALGIS